MTSPVPEMPAPRDVCWPVSWACAEEFAACLPDEIIAIAESLAGQTLRALTGYAVGGCPITVRPCAVRCTPEAYRSYQVASGSTWQPYFTNGQWVNGCGCRTPVSCSCTRVNEVVLPGPVGRIDAVKIDGVALDPSTYRVDNGNRLVRMDGQAWPICQDMNDPDTEDGTFSVTYLRGHEVDGTGAFAAGLLAREFAKACMGEGCSLPPGVVGVVANGVSVEIEPAHFPNGITGIPVVDAYVRTWNPYGKKVQGAVVYSANYPRPRVQGS